MFLTIHSARRTLSSLFVVASLGASSVAAASSPTTSGSMGLQRWIETPHFDALDEMYYHERHDDRSIRAHYATRLFHSLTRQQLGLPDSSSYSQVREPLRASVLRLKIRWEECTQASRAECTLFRVGRAFFPPVSELIWNELPETEEALRDSIADQIDSQVRFHRRKDVILGRVSAAGRRNAERFRSEPIRLIEQQAYLRAIDPELSLMTLEEPLREALFSLIRNAREEWILAQALLEVEPTLSQACVLYRGSSASLLENSRSHRDWFQLFHPQENLGAIALPQIRCRA